MESVQGSDATSPAQAGVRSRPDRILGLSSLGLPELSSTTGHCRNLFSPGPTTVLSPVTNLALDMDNLAGLGSQYDTPKRRNPPVEKVPSFASDVSSDAGLKGPSSSPAGSSTKRCRSGGSTPFQSSCRLSARPPRTRTATGYSARGRRARRPRLWARTRRTCRRRALSSRSPPSRRPARAGAPSPAATPRTPWPGAPAPPPPSWCVPPPHCHANRAASGEMTPDLCPLSSPRLRRSSSRAPPTAAPCSCGARPTRPPCATTRTTASWRCWTATWRCGVPLRPCSGVPPANANICCPAGRVRDADGLGQPADGSAGGRRRSPGFPRGPLAASEPLPLPVHAHPAVPALGQAPRLSRRRSHARQGEEAAQPGRLARHQPGAGAGVSQSGLFSAPEVQILLPDRHREAPGRGGRRQSADRGFHQGERGDGRLRLLPAPLV
ncbi:unnamed protein product [Tetraodon nigroviridis]|uniref:(spotted green pufferfish) hypothetical protein n=1 Tax=Tetraodon nigroviridis TaxID=99883 RepID=Q4SDM4_TETNG|nr:unnamed protein product [Tetraodon nigroviridis]